MQCFMSRCYVALIIMREFIVCCYDQGEITIGDETIKFAKGDLIKTNENDMFKWLEEAHHDHIKVAIYEAKMVCDLS